MMGALGELPSPELAAALIGGVFLFGLVGILLCLLLPIRAEIAQALLRAARRVARWLDALAGHAR